MKYIITLLLIFCGGFFLRAQDCDCTYPIIFVHGWAGDETSWQGMSNEIESVWGDSLMIPGDNSPLTEGTVYYANLNWQYGQTNLTGANGVVEYNNSYVDDDVVVHEQFNNAPLLLPNRCVYAVSFNTRRDPNDASIKLVHSNSSEWGQSATPVGESDSNEASAYKQGYALGRAINAILQASGKNKVILVAHSMGGLAAREYLQRSVAGSNVWWVNPNVSDGHKVAKLLTVGTPHRGSNVGNTVSGYNAVISALSATAMDLKSEAVRDLRYFYNNGAPTSGTYNNSAYQFGNGEASIINYPAFYNNDVDCNGTDQESIEGINQNGIAAGFAYPWEGTTENPLLPLPLDVKYTYYVSDGQKSIERQLIDAGNMITSDWLDWLVSLMNNSSGSNNYDQFEQYDSDGIVSARRQWLFNGGDGSDAEHLNGTSIPSPYGIENYLVSDRFTTTSNAFHTTNLSLIPGLIGETEDYDQISRGIDEGDYPFFAGKVELNTWYAGTPNLRADKVPASSEYTGNGSNTIDGDWYKVTLPANYGSLKIAVDVADDQPFITRLDVYGDVPTNFYANNEDGTVHFTQDVSNNGEFFAELTACHLSAGKTIYFRITNALLNIPQPETAWRSPYKFRVTADCPASPDCDYTFSSYGTSGCDYDCAERYDGTQGNLRIPVHFVTAGDNVQTTLAEFDAQLNDVNIWAQNAAGLNWSFYRASDAHLIGSDYDDWLSVPNNQTATQNISNEINNNPNALVVFAVNSPAVATAGYPHGVPIPSADTSNYVFLSQNYISDGQWAVLAHEIGHIFGLFHTFDCDAFPTYNNCSTGCRSGDGIDDTPFTAAPYDGIDNDPNFMDYDELAFSTIPNFFPNITATTCQVAKMNDLLFSCRNNLGLPLQMPTVQDKNNGTTVGNLTGFYNGDLDTLMVTLNGDHYSNDAGFGYWTFARPNGSTFSLWADTLDLNTLYTNAQINSPGTYTVEVFDRRYYNDAAQSTPYSFSITLDACNLNSICEPWETTTDCADCQFGTNNANLDRVEYYLDNDPGYGQATEVPGVPNNFADLNFNVDLSNVDPGIHTLYVRARDDQGNWSFTQRRMFYVYDAPGNGTASLERLEYYLDDDPGYGQAIELPLADPQDSQADYNIDLSTVNPGIHTLYVRARDSYGRWSFIQRRMFYVFDAPGGGASQLTRLEYFLDDDPGYGQATELPLADPQDSQADYNIDLSTVNPGIHTLYVRARDSHGRWSFVQRRMFYVYDAPGGPREIVKVEYYVDGPSPDYGQATNIPITPNDSIEVDFTVPTNGLDGNHILYVRAQDNFGQWSFTVSDTLIWSDRAIEVLSPNGGQTYTAGISSLSNINWDTTGNVGDVDIWLIKPNGQEIVKIADNVDQGEPFAGPWTIPVWVNSGQYRIKVNSDDEPSILGYSENTFTINSPPTTFCSGFTDLSAAGETLDAASCLCERGMVTPKYYDSFNTYGVNVAGNLERGDLAKLTYLLLYPDDQIVPAANYAVPFADLQNNSTFYFKYAKALSYLEYDDGISVFNRNFINFRPFDGITGKFVMKVLLEAVDIAPDPSGPSPYANLLTTDDGYGYVKEAYNRGWLPADFDPQALMVRSVAFVILKRMIDSLGGSCIPTSTIVTAPTSDDYAVPGNFTPMNLARSVSMAEGYFPAFFNTSFQFPGVGIPLVYKHGYQAHHVELPPAFHPLSPLGVGWTHSFNSYIIEEAGWSNVQGSFSDKVYVMWAGGSLHCYDKLTRQAETHGVFSTLTRIGQDRYEIKKKSQIVYGFERYTTISGSSIWMLVDITDRNGNQIQIAIDDTQGEPRVQSVTGSGGYTLNFSYDADGNLESVIDPAGGRTILYSVDTDGNLASYTNAKGDVTSFGYGSAPSDHLLYTVTLPEGNGITNTYDDAGRLASSQVNGQTNSTLITPVYDYTQTTPLTSTLTDTEGNTMTQSFNSNGYLSSVSDNGDDLSVSYHAQYPSLPISLVSNGTTVGTTYDDRGNPLTISLPLGITHTFSYNGNNDVTHYTNPRGKTTVSSYDGNGNLDKVTDPNGNVTDYYVDNKGQVIWTESAEGVKFTNQYNTDGTLFRTTGPEALYQEFLYDPGGRKISSENANGQLTTYQYDILDQMIQMTRKSDEGDIITKYRFNANMLMDSVINAHNHATTIAYNNQNQPVAIQFGDDVDQMTYDEEGRLDFTTTPANEVLDIDYDDRDRVEFDGYRSITYDDRNNPLTVTHAGRTTTITYDAVDRPKTVTYDNKTVEYDYDPNTNLTNLKYADDTEIDYVFDNADRLVQIKLGTLILVQYSYRMDNQLDRIDYSNGTYCLHIYDGAGRLIGKAWHKSDDSVICSYDITL